MGADGRGAQHVGGVDVKHLLGTEVGPDALEARDRASPAMRLGGEHAGRDRAGGGADDDLERITRARQQLGEREQHAHLVRRARTAARQHQADGWPVGRPEPGFAEAVHWVYPAPIMKPATLNAV